MKPTPEEKCSHEWIQKTGLGYHCRKCRTAKIRPSPSHEAKCEHDDENPSCPKNQCVDDGIHAKCSCPEARVDWDREAEIVWNRIGLTSLHSGQKLIINHALQAAYEAGVKKGEKK